jgi:hypothetical protein
VTPEQRLHQSKVKYRIIGQRQLRAFMRGELSYLPRCGMQEAQRQPGKRRKFHDQRL